MKIEKNDIIDCTSLTFCLLKQIDDKANYFREKAIRCDQLSCAMLHYFNEGKITDTNMIDAAISLMNHTNKSVDEIMNIVLNIDP